MKTDVLSVAGMKMELRFVSKAEPCQFVPPPTPGVVRLPALDTWTRFDTIGRPVGPSPVAQVSLTKGAPARNFPVVLSRT